MPEPSWRATRAFPRTLADERGFDLHQFRQAVSNCHCTDCQLGAGAPMIVWAESPESEVRVTKGTPRTIDSSRAAMRSFCPECGSGLFYRNEEILPGRVEVQASTLDDPAALPPTFLIQTAERAWGLAVDPGRWAAPDRRSSGKSRASRRGICFGPSPGPRSS